MQSKEMELLKSVYFLSLFTVFAGVCCVNINEGKECHLRSGESGRCKLFSHCPSFHEDLIKGIMPIACAFDGMIPFICCPASGAVVKNESIGIEERIRKVPGEIAKFWCKKYLEICDSDEENIVETLPYVRRFRRDIFPTENPDDEDFGTTEATQKEVTTSNTVFKDAGYVTGGENAMRDEFPHMAAIGYGNQNNIKWLCGGSLISEKHILTAAHCLSSISYGPAKWVRLGAHVMQDEIRGTSVRALKGQTHRILKRIRHPGYRPPSKYNDVALIEIGPTLETSSLPTISKTIHPACLQVEYDGNNFTYGIATGWGKLGFYDDPSATLQKVKLSFLDKSYCDNTYKYEIKWSKALKKGIDDSVLCIGELGGGKDTCIGDSGGPIQILLAEGTCKYSIVGITSFGKVCGFTNSPAVYMNVSYYVPWIESIVWPEF